MLILALYPNLLNVSLYNKKLVSDAFVDDIERTKKAGMNEHFSKPLAMEKVIEAIGNYSKKITKI